MEHPLVSMVNGTPTTSSLLVAQTFGKRHDHVLRDIEKVIAQLPEDFSQPNFGAANYLDAQGKSRLMYLLTRDAFTLLVMGYTGKEAMAFKVKYIEAFNAMEEELRKQEKPKPKRKPKALPSPTSPEAIRHPDGSMLYLDLLKLEPISLTDLVDVLTSLEYRMERTCHTITDADWKAGARRFYEAAGTDHILTNMLSCTLAGPRFATLDLIKAAASMARKAQRMHELVCDCR